MVDQDTPDRDMAASMPRPEARQAGTGGPMTDRMEHQVDHDADREEFLFRGLLLPRMRQAFGKWDWVANGVLFAVYHLHQPWSIPATLVDGIFLEAYPSKRFQSAWMGIIVHSSASVFALIVVLGLVLG